MKAGRFVLDVAGMAAALALQQRSFFDGFHLVDRKRREFNPGRGRRGQGAKFDGETLRQLRAERGVGSVRRIRAG